VKTVLVTHPLDVCWLSGYWQNPHTYHTQQAAAALRLTRNESRLFLDLPAAKTASAHVDKIETLPWYDGLHSASVRGESVLTAAGAESDIPPEMLRSIVAGLRRAKDPDETAQIVTCIQAAEAGYAAAQNRIVPGMTELEAYDVVHSACVQYVGGPVHLYGDFASGPNAAGGGGGPTRRIIERSDLFLLDFSVVLNGYRGDLCATWTVGADPSEEQRELAQLCLQAMQAGETALLPGTPAAEVYHRVRGVFERAGMEKYFPHHAGHGIGLGHPDPPYFVRESSDTVLENEVVTLEPGLYVPGTGGMRFEHNYVVRQEGPERLSNHRLFCG
jgi:Xaa-Pro aminopeptidase